ncbi:hypothetical protein [Pedobacter sp. B4-66]|uniref:hypothetical protein n=1 Tax=Pedobacter sp. B4-66 TaxID=2817280 RepID=UPI001BDA11D0|nr:hypothetical protein [Pedobacter sp. B4-66]
MKKLIFLTLLGAIGLLPNKLKAQVSLSVNIGSQPAWGPSGYDRADYYYMPDIESYYYVPTRQFIYLSNGNWTFSAGLPPRYRDYDLYNGYKVVINSPRPYDHYRDHRVRYARYRSYHSQPIRYSRPVRYVERDYDRHDRHDKHDYKRYKERGNGRGNGHGHGHGHGKH